MSIDFRYSGVEYEYDGRECDSDCPCHDGDYCRRNRMIDLRVDKINIPAVVETILKNYDFSGEEFIPYCLDRVLRFKKVYLSEAWDIRSSMGYYGEEIDSIFLNEEKEIIDILVELSKKEPSDRIRHVLKMEYGFLLKKLRDANFESRTVSGDELTIQNEEYSKKIEPGDIYSDNFNYEIGIYEPLSFVGKYKVIDGYHRYSQLVKGKKKQKIIVAL